MMKILDWIDISRPRSSQNGEATWYDDSFVKLKLLRMSGEVSAAIDYSKGKLAKPRKGMSILVKSSVEIIKDVLILREMDFSFSESEFTTPIFGTVTSCDGMTVSIDTGIETVVVHTALRLEPGCCGFFVMDSSRLVSSSGISSL